MYLVTFHHGTRNNKWPITPLLEAVWQLVAPTQQHQLHPVKLISGSDVIPAAPDRAASLQEQPIRLDTHHISHRAAQHSSTASGLTRRAAFTSHLTTAGSGPGHHGQRAGKKTGFMQLVRPKITAAPHQCGITAPVRHFYSADRSTLLWCSGG